MKREITTKNAPAAIGPYSQAVDFAGLIFCAGQIGTDNKFNTLKKGITAQTNQVFKNIKAVLQAAGSGMDNVLKVEVYLKEMADFPVMNEIYKNQFKKPYPARATVQVARLPKDALIEIACIAFRNLPDDKDEYLGCCGGC